MSISEPGDRGELTGDQLAVLGVVEPPRRRGIECQVGIAEVARDVGDQPVAGRVVLVGADAGPVQRGDALASMARSSAGDRGLSSSSHVRLNSCTARAR